MSKVCMKMKIAGISPNTCIGRELCGEWNKCNGHITIHKPKIEVRKIKD